MCNAASPPPTAPQSTGHSHLVPAAAPAHLHTCTPAHLHTCTPAPALPTSNISLLVPLSRAIQNYKEPAGAEMMDVADSPVPKVSSKFEAQQQQQQQQRRPQAPSSATFCSSREASEELPQLDIATAYKLVAMAQSQLQQEMEQRGAALQQQQQQAQAQPSTDEPAAQAAQAGAVPRQQQRSRLAQPGVRGQAAAQAIAT